MGVGNLSYVNISDGTKIYYELHGDQDKPILLFLNGIMMSTVSWNSFIEPFTRNFRVLLMDFRDQGKSSKMEKQYDISIHASDILQLLDELKIEKVIPVGVSYGGQVAQIFASTYPERVKALVLANTVARIMPYLAELGESWKEAARLEDGEKFFVLAIPTIYSDYFYNRNLGWLKARQKLFKKALTPEWFQGFIRLASSNPDFNTMDQLSSISAPTILLAGDRDTITPIEEMELIEKEIPDTQFVIIHNGGHASFLEKQKEFINIVTGFAVNITQQT